MIFNLSLVSWARLPWSPYLPALTGGSDLADNKQNMNRSTKVGMLLLCLFALPFAGFGLFAFSGAMRLALAGQTNIGSGSRSFWYPLFFGVVFSAVGFGLMFVAFYGAKILQRQQRLRVEHPTEPWLWQEDWAQGRVKSKTRSNTIAGWVFAVFWNVVSMPVAFLAFPQIAKQKNPLVYIVLIFPMIGVFLLIRAIRQTIALFEFGKTYFEMSSVPGVIGRELKGQIQARFPHSPDHGIHLRLSCVHRVTTGSGKSQSTHENIVWRDESDLVSAQLYPGSTGTTIPVDFRIPLDAQPTEKRNVRDEFVWTLEALADVPGVDYHDIFEVPVFRTAETPTQSEVANFAVSTMTQAVTRPQVMTVVINQTSDGTEFYFPAARNRGFATTTTMFCLIFGTVSFFLIHRAPFIFPLAFGFFSLLLLYITLQMWLATTRVVIGGSGMTVQAGWLGGGKIRRIELSEIATISDRITAQQGGGSGTPFYDIELRLHSGEKITLGHTVRDKRETEWLVGEMMRLSGVQTKSMTAGMA